MSHSDRKEKSAALLVKGKGKQVVTSTSKLEDADSDAEEKEEESCSDSNGDCEDLTPEELEQLDNEALAFMARRFKKLKFQKRTNFRKPTTAPRRQNTSSTDKSKVTCYKCHELGHFASECKKKSREDKTEDFYKKKYFDLLKSTKKGKAFLVEGKDWADSDEEEEEQHVNLALMASSNDESTSQVAFEISSNMSKADCHDTIQEMSNEICNLFNTLRKSTKENERLTHENSLLVSRNAFLEAERINLEALKSELAKTKNLLECSIESDRWARQKLKEEKEVIDGWINSSKKLQEQFDKLCIRQREGLGFSQNYKADDQCGKPESSIKGDSGKKPILFVKSSADEKVEAERKSVDKILSTEVKIAKSVDKLLSPESTSAKPEEASSSTTKGRRNRNGKAGISKATNYAPSADANRKSCWKCNSSKHLAYQCSIFPDKSSHCIEMPNSKKKHLKGKDVKAVVEKKHDKHEHVMKLESVNNLHISKTVSKPVGPKSTWVPKAT